MRRIFILNTLISNSDVEIDPLQLDLHNGVDLQSIVIGSLINLGLSFEKY